MRNSSGMSTVFTACTILALAIASEASKFVNSQATITASPAAGTITSRNQPIAGACGAFDLWAVAPSGATCEGFALDNRITVDEFLVMNPDINPECSNLEVGNRYCVGTYNVQAVKTSSSTSPPPKTSSPPPKTTSPPATSPIVFRSYCTTTPGTCLNGATGTDGVTYTTGCCNGCGPAGVCGMDGAAGGALTFYCTCADIAPNHRRTFNDVGAASTWLG